MGEMAKTESQACPDRGEETTGNFIGRELADFRDNRVFGWAGQAKMQSPTSIVDCRIVSCCSCHLRIFAAKQNHLNISICL